MTEQLPIEDWSPMSTGYFTGEQSPRNDSLEGLIPPGSYQPQGDALVPESAGAEGQLTGHIGASIELLAIEHGGRSGPLPEGAWHCTLKVGEEYLDGRIYFDPTRQLNPGDSADAIVALLEPDRAGLFQLGTEFEIWEGRRVGSGSARALF